MVHSNRDHMQRTTRDESFIFGTSQSQSPLLFETIGFFFRFSPTCCTRSRLFTTSATSTDNHLRNLCPTEGLPRDPKDNTQVTDTLYLMCRCNPLTSLSITMSRVSTNQSSRQKSDCPLSRPYLVGTSRLQKTQDQFRPVYLQTVTYFMYQRSP